MTRARLYLALAVRLSRLVDWLIVHGRPDRVRVLYRLPPEEESAALEAWVAAGKLRPRGRPETGVRV